MRTASRDHAACMRALDADVSELQTARDALVTRHQDERDALNAKHSGDLAAYDADAISKLEAKEQDERRAFAEAEAQLACEDAPKVKAMLGKFVQSPSVQAAKESIATWQAFASLVETELGEHVHPAVLLGALCGDDARLAGARDLFGRNGAAFKLARAIEAGTIGPVQTMASILSLAGDLEAKLSTLKPDAARTAAMAEHVSQSSIDAVLGITPHHIDIRDGRVFDGRTWRKVPTGSTPADVLKTSSIADAFRAPPAAPAPPSSFFADRQARTFRVEGTPNGDVAASLAIARQYGQKK